MSYQPIKQTLKGQDLIITGVPGIGRSFQRGYFLIDSLLEPYATEQMETMSGIVYFAPSLDTPVCQMSTKKLLDLSKKYPHFRFLTITCDTPFAHKRFCSEHETSKSANFKTLSTMSAPRFLVAHGLQFDTFPLRGAACRALFVLSRGKVSYLEIPADVANEPNYELAEMALKKIIHH